MVHFSWELEPNRDPGTHQVAAQVVVTAELDGAVVFDSGRHNTDQPALTNTAATAMTLASDARYSWTVRIWAVDGLSAVSAPTTFSTGLLSSNVGNVGGRRRQLTLPPSATGIAP